MKREFSAGGVVFKKEGGKILWLLRRNRPSQLYPAEDHWTLPKGWIEAGEKAEQAAVREVAEEGWVRARVRAKIADEKYVYTPRGGERTFKIVSFFLMEYVKDVPKRVRKGEVEETAEAEWLPYEEARKRLIFSGEKKVLDKARQMFAN